MIDDPNMESEKTFAREMQQLAAFANLLQLPLDEMQSLSDTPYAAAAQLLNRASRYEAAFNALSISEAQSDERFRDVVRIYYFVLTAAGNMMLQHQGKNQIPSGWLTGYSQQVVARALRSADELLCRHELSTAEDIRATCAWATEQRLIPLGLSQASMAAGIWRAALGMLTEERGTLAHNIILDMCKLWRKTISTLEQTA